MSHLYGVTHPSGTIGLLVVVCSFMVLHQSLFTAQLNISGGMVPDIADEMALQPGMCQEGTINSGMMLVQKMTFGFGAFLLVLL